jgi:hypothetical protein
MSEFLQALMSALDLLKQRTTGDARQFVEDLAAEVDALYNDEQSPSDAGSDAAECIYDLRERNGKQAWQ